MSVRRRALAIGAALLALAGCTSKPDYPTYHFKSLAELADTLKPAGWSCSGARDEGQTRDSIAKYGWTQASCNDGALALYSSDAKRAELQANPWNALKPGWCRLDGGNWMVSGAQYQVEDAEKIVGGRKQCG